MMAAMPRTPSAPKPPSRRAAPLALAIMVALAGPALAQSGARPFGLESSGWTLVTASEDTWVYMKATTSADRGVRRVWTAYDSDRARERQGFRFHSVQSLAEFDCGRGLSRVVEETFHDSPGLKGKTWQAPNFTPTEWVAPAPSSIGAIRLAYACRTLSET